jgi:hypothetical protein
MRRIRVLASAIDPDTWLPVFKFCAEAYTDIEPAGYWQCGHKHVSALDAYACGRQHLGYDPWSLLDRPA